MLLPHTPAARWRRRIQAACLVLAVACPPAAVALDPDAQFRDYAIDNWGADSGLPQVSVMSITQDATGYIWVGTQNGLARFDGLRFDVFDRRNSDGTEPLNANASLRDRRGRLWFGTPNGLILYENQHFRTIEAKVPVKPVHAIIESDEGEVWVATSNGAMRYTDEGLVQVGAAEPVYSLARDTDSIWLGGTGTVTRRSADGERVFPVAAGAHVTRLAASESGLWIGTPVGLYLLAPGASTAQLQPLAAVADTSDSDSSRIENLCIDRDRNVWVGTPSTLFRRRPNGSIERVRVEDFARSVYVVSAFEDREGNLWFGSRTEGLFRLWNGWAMRLGAREGLTDSVIWSVTRDPAGRIVFGSNSNVMRLGDKGLEEILSTRQVPNLSAYELSYDARGRLWVGMRSGLVVFDQGKDVTPPVFKRFARSQINVILPMEGGVHWIGGQQGLFRYDGTNLTQIPPAAGVADSPVRGIHISSNGMLTVSTEAGVRRLEGDVLQPPAWAKPLEGLFVTSITTIKPGLLGITMRDAGIALMSDDHLLQMDDRHGLPSSNTWAMQVLDDYLYVSSIEGVWRVPVADLPDPATAAKGALLAAERVLGRRTGMQHMHCCNGGARSRIQADGNRLWFPAIHGAVRVDTKAIVPAPLPPTVVVEQLRHGGRVYRAGETIHIDGPKRDIEVQFTALSFREPQSVQFRYRLDGYDSEWHEVGNRRTAFYTNLPAGEYRFRVEARANNAHAQFATGGNPQRAEMAFRLVPRWHERRSVQATAIGVMFAVAALAPLAIRNRYRRRGLQLEEQVLTRTRELRDANVRQSHANQALHESNTQLATQIEERLAAERALQGRNAELLALNNKLEGTQNQLIQSEKMASVGQLAAGVAHEINNPIGYVHSNLNSLERYIRDILELLDVYSSLENASPDHLGKALSNIAEQRKRIQLEFLREDIGNLLSESLHGISRVEKIVRDLKDFSHVGEAEWQLVDIHEGIESTLNVVAHEIKYKAKLIKDYSEVPKIECLPFQLNQVFMNLLVNAAQAIEEQGEIRIRTEADEQEVRVSISDNGKGISQAHLHRIFEPFFTTKPVGKGTGLGLSVSYGIVQKHGGQLNASSVVGKGTTFTVHLPIRRVTAK